MLQSLGHRATIASDYTRNTDLLIAIHATHSRDQFLSFFDRFPNRPTCLVLSGTDIYATGNKKPPTILPQLKAATKVIVFQKYAALKVPKSLRSKVSVLYHAAIPVKRRPKPLTSCFEIVVSGHLRDEKDPMRAAMAVRKLPGNSKVRVTHLGKILDSKYTSLVRREMETNKRYHWLGDQPLWRARQIVARSRLLVHTSILEGGANVIAEALVDRVPIIASKIHGNVGLLGDSYPGYFPVRNTNMLQKLIARAESDTGFYKGLVLGCKKRAPIFTVKHETKQWKQLINSFS